jgi:hypothetical protein
MPFSMNIRKLQNLLSKYPKAASSYDLADLGGNHVRTRIYLMESVVRAIGSEVPLGALPLRQARNDGRAVFKKDDETDRIVVRRLRQ